MPLTEETGEEFYSARSQFSNGGLDVEYDFTDAAAIVSPFRNLASSNESSRMLSEAENQLLNAKIDGLIAAIQDHPKPQNRSGPASTVELIRSLPDEENDILDDKIERLVSAIESGRQLHFLPDSRTGVVGITAAYHEDRSDYGLSDLEARIAESQENFGTVLRPGDHRRTLRSVDSIISAISSSYDSYGASSHNLSNDLGRAVAAANIRFALEHGIAAHGSTTAQRFPQHLADGQNEDRGRYLAFYDHANALVKVRSFSPILLNFKKEIRLSTTPSIDSGGSELDCSSPLYEKSIQALLKQPNRRNPYSTSHSGHSGQTGLNDNISSWLKGTKTPPPDEELAASPTTEKAFDVWQDLEMDKPSIKGIRKPAPVAKALKDVSNLRQPGYLQHNSFADDKARAIPPAQSRPLGSANQPFGGASDHDSRRKYLTEKWLALLADAKNKRNADTSSTVEFAKVSKTGPKPHRKPQFLPLDRPLTPQQPLDNPLRSANFDFTLARLEGRVAPQSYSPIRRYAILEGVYGSDVEIERRSLRRKHPKPKRDSSRQTAAQRFEQSLGADIDRADEFWDRAESELVGERPCEDIMPK